MTDAKRNELIAAYRRQTMHLDNLEHIHAMIETEITLSRKEADHIASELGLISPPELPLDMLAMGDGIRPAAEAAPAASE